MDGSWEGKSKYCYEFPLGNGFIGDAICMIAGRY
jgi:hypothetical protein